MKKHLISFIHKPFLVATVSVVIAVGIGAVEYQHLISSIAYQFTPAISGTILDTNSDALLQHTTIGFLTGGKVQSVNVKVGDAVKKGQIMATLNPESTSGALTQANAAYASAKANYEKVVNGATASTIDVAKTSVATAQQNLDQLIQNAPTQVDNILHTDIDSLYYQLNSYSPQFEIVFFDASSNTNVTIQPSDVGQKITLGQERVDMTKLISAWTNASSTDRETSVRYGLSNLNTVKKYLIDVSMGVNSLTYDSKYQTNMNQYKANVAAARSAIDTLINNLQNADQGLVTANASASSVISSARPEDIAAAKAQMDNALGILQIAEASYNDRIMLAPGDAVITAVHLNVGEVYIANSPAVELAGQNLSKNVAIMIPKNSVIDKNDKQYVLVKEGDNNVVEKEVTVGISDSENTEILSGINVGDQVVIR